MKKLGIVAALVVALAVFTGGGAYASGGPLLVEEGFACGVLDGNGDIHITTNSLLVWFSSGKVYLRCEAEGLPNPTGQVVNWNFGNTGIFCGLLQFGSTDQWRNRVGREGTSQLECHGYQNPGQGAAAFSLLSSGAGIG
jgi:hypothetical protein